jgi:hypothetical protein
MGRQARDMSLRVSFLLFPHPAQLAGCGWVEHNSRIAFRVVNGFGTLLGPEETPCRLVGVFLVPLPALDRLTHPVARACVARACVWVWWWLWGLGCGGVLSVA